MCSDGLWQEVRDAEIENVLTAVSDPQQVCERLIDKANFAGGEDNISLIYARID